MAEERKWLKKESGSSLPRWCWWRTPPMAVSEALVVMDKVTSRRGWMSMVALEMAVFTWFMSVIISRVMVKSFLALERESVRGRMM